MPTWDPGDYHCHSSAQQGWARELIAKLQLKGDERVLDIGCGDGKMSAEIAENVPRGRVVGVDSSEAMIRFACQAYPPEQHPRLSFKVRDARDLGFNREFDLVYSNATLHWIVDHRPVLAGVARALVPGGRALLQMGGQGNAAAILGLLDAMSQEARWSPYLKGFPCPYGFHAPSTYRPWVEAAGLRAERLELIDKDMTQLGPEGLAGWMRTTWLPYLERIDEKLRLEFVTAVVERYLHEHPLDDEGLIHVGMVRLEADLTLPG